MSAGADTPPSRRPPAEPGGLGGENAKENGFHRGFPVLSSKQEPLCSLVFDLIKVSPIFLGGNREHYISERAIHPMVHFMCLSDFKAVCTCVYVCVFLSQNQYGAPRSERGHLWVMNQLESVFTPSLLL